MGDFQKSSFWKALVAPWIRNIFIGAAFMILGHVETAFAEEQNRQAYLPQTFTDENRLNKIHAVFPEIEKMYKEYAEKNHFPGYAYGILVDGNLVFAGAGGFMDLDQKIPVTAKSMFRIASISKSFTAMAILKLRDEGRLKLDDPVNLYFSEMGQGLTEDSPLITLRDLLTHSGGLPTDDPWADRKLGETDEDLHALLKKGIFFSNTPGTTFEYSNLGYAILGDIIQKITGMPYGKFISETIWKPLGLIDGSWEFRDVPPSQLVHGYRWIDQEWKEEAMLPDGIFGAMGGMIASVESFSRYVALHQSAWPPRNDRDTGPLKRSSLREMQKPWSFKALILNKTQEGEARAITSGYGYGLGWLRDHQGKVIVGHNGGLPGFGSNWYIMPEYGIGVILFANVTYAPTWTINTEVLEMLVKAAELKPRQLPPSQILKERQNALFKLLPSFEGAKTSGIFAENFFLDNPQDALIRSTKQLFAKAGKIIAITECVPENQLRGSFVIQCENLDILVGLTLTPENPPLIQKIEAKEMEKK